jgi:cytochrome c oxidase cbb3-type subunit 4
MELNDLRSIVTVISLMTFLGIVWWAYGIKGNKKRFDEAANLPFADDEADRAELGSVRNEKRKTS